MPRAFSEEERTQIRERLLETALDLFHENGKKSLSIAELTRRAGIAQGSFYSFWPDKDALIADLVTYRARQKLSKLGAQKPKRGESLTDFLTRLLLETSLDMTHKIRTLPMYAEAFALFRNKERMQGLLQLYGEFLSRITGEKQRVDREGLEAVMTGAFVLCAEAGLFNEKYFGEILETYLKSGLARYLQ